MKLDKHTDTAVDTIEVTPEIVKSWKSAPFQRPLKENEKVRNLAAALKADGGVWPGIVTLGLLGKDTYLIDGQHRRLAFILAAIPKGYTDVRIHAFESMAEMGAEFVELNSQLVRMQPDDVLRGLEASNEHLKRIRKHLPFVGYDMIRRSPKTAVVSASACIKAWMGSLGDCPKLANGSAISVVKSLTDQEVESFINFMTLAFTAFGRDPEYHRLWGQLNLTLCMWMYRRIVLSQYSQRSARITADHFRKALTGLSASPEYLDWLVGRNMTERDRAPGYYRLKLLFARRLELELERKVSLPQPSWATK